MNTNYLPANCKIFAIVFYHKDLSETVIRAIVGEDINIADPLVEHQNDKRWRRYNSRTLKRTRYTRIC